MGKLCIGFLVDTSVTQQCTLLYQTTDYDSSQTNLIVSNEATTFLRYDIHLARIEKKLCNKVQALPNLATSGIATQSSEWGLNSCPCPAARAIDQNPGYDFSVESCSVTGNGDNEWWLLDMKQQEDVEIVRLSNRINAHIRMSNFEIRIGMNSIDFSQNALCYNMSEIAPSGETTNFQCLNVTRGRYVSIKRYFPYDANGKWLQICEAQIVPPIPDTSQFNIAPYGVASQSSEFAPASRAVDGFSDPDWLNEYSCTHTDPAHTTPGWWMLDMKQTRTVRLVRLTNRNVAPERLFNFEIRVGFNDTDFSENTLCYYMAGMVGNAATEDFPCLLPTRGRYLSIQRLIPLGPSGKTVLTLCEVQIFQTGC